MNRIIYAVFAVGLLFNLYAGVLLQEVFHFSVNDTLVNATEIINVAPSFISMVFLGDALRRLRKASKGVLQMETWQLVWHIWSFFSVFVSGVLLSISVRKAWTETRFFYVTYVLLLVFIFLCEVPFIFILNKIMSQGVKQGGDKIIKIEDTDIEIQTDVSKGPDEIMQEHGLLTPDEKSNMTETIQ